MKYQEIRKNLFTIHRSYTLAHCISRDAEMGKGIALEFQRRYPNMPNFVRSQRPQIGDTVPYDGGDRWVFNLVTKERYWHKPTDNTFKASIESLKTEMEALGVKKLAIPLLGAGLDRLSWKKNQETIQQVFADTDVEILVCHKE